MALQTENRALIGLGVLADTQPDSKQPRPAEGNHFRWPQKRDLGGPSFGFYVFRHPHLVDLSCLSSVQGQVSSDQKALTDGLFPAGQTALELNSTLPHTMPAVELARDVGVLIGLQGRLSFSTAHCPRTSIHGE